MANISTFDTWSTTAASNQPDGTDSATIKADLQQIQAEVRKHLGTKGSDIASAATTDLSAATGNIVDVTGVTTITSFGTLAAGLWKIVRFTGALTLTHNATSLMLPGNANITTAAGDCLLAYSLGSGNWVVPFYQKDNGNPILLDAPPAIGGTTPAAGTFTTLSSTGNTTLGDATGDTVTVNGSTVTLAGSSTRITGDFSNATNSSRAMFKTSTTNGNTIVGTVPNGTSLVSGIRCYETSDPDNSGYGDFRTDGTYLRITSVYNGTGTARPILMAPNGISAAIFGTDGSVLATNTGGLGYGTGSGGTVTQATSKTTGVTLNKPTGQITMTGEALAAGATVEFQLTNSVIAATDTIVAVVANDAGYTATNYSVGARQAASGSVYLYVKNESGGSLSNAVKINFAVIKGVTS